MNNRDKTLAATRACEHNPIDDVVDYQYCQPSSPMGNPMASYNDLESRMLDAIDNSLQKEATGYKIALLIRQGYLISEISVILNVERHRLVKILRAWHKKAYPR